MHICVSKWEQDRCSVQQTCIIMIDSEAGRGMQKTYLFNTVVVIPCDDVESMHSPWDPALHNLDFAGR